MNTNENQTSYYHNLIRIAKTKTKQKMLTVKDAGKEVAKLVEK